MNIFNKLAILHWFLTLLVATQTQISGKFNIKLLFDILSNNDIIPMHTLKLRTSTDFSTDLN